MDKWPPDSIDPRDPDWINAKAAEKIAGVSLRIIYENMQHYGIKWFGKYYISKTRLCSTAWEAKRVKKSATPEQPELDANW